MVDIYHTMPTDNQRPPHLWLCLNLKNWSNVHVCLSVRPQKETASYAIEATVTFPRCQCLIELCLGPEDMEPSGLLDGGPSRLFDCNLQSGGIV